MDFGAPPEPDVAGEALSHRAVLYMQNVQSVDDAVATVVHESSHVTQMARRIEVPHAPTQMNEYLAFRREALYSLGRRPSLAERLELMHKVRRLYPSLPSGGLKGH